MHRPYSVSKYRIIGIKDVRKRPDGSFEIKAAWAPTWESLSALCGADTVKEAENMVKEKFGASAC